MTPACPPAARTLPGRTMPRRTEQFAATLQRSIQAILARGLHDPRIRGLITVTAVTVSADRRSAQVFVSVLPQQCESTTMHGLRAATGHIRHQLARDLPVRRVPELQFRIDPGPKRHAAILAAIARAAQELPPATDPLPSHAPEPPSHGDHAT